MSRQWSKSFTAPVLTVGRMIIELTTGTRNLGVHFHNQLDLKQLVSNVCCVFHFQFHQLHVVRWSLSCDVLRTLLLAFIACHLDYCNSLLVSLPACDIRRLQTVQNAGAILYGELSIYWSYDTDSSWWPALASSGAEDTEQDRCPHFQSTAWSCATHSQIDVCSDCFQLVTVKELISCLRGSHWSTNSIKDVQLLCIAPIFWNNILTDLRQSPSLTKFSSELGTYLFREAYNISA